MKTDECEWYRRKKKDAKFHLCDSKCTNIKSQLAYMNWMEYMLCDVIASQSCNCMYVIEILTQKNLFAKNFTHTKYACLLFFCIRRWHTKLWVVHCIQLDGSVGSHSCHPQNGRARNVQMTIAACLMVITYMRSRLSVDFFGPRAQASHHQTDLGFNRKLDHWPLR